MMGYTLKTSSAATYCSGAMQFAGSLGGVLLAAVGRWEQVGEGRRGCPEGEAWHGPSGGGSCLLTAYDRSSPKGNVSNVICGDAAEFLQASLG